MNDEDYTCQDLNQAIQGFIDAANDWIERRRIIREIVIPIVIALMPGWPLIDPDGPAQPILDWIDGILIGKHVCAAYFEAQGSGG